MSDDSSSEDDLPLSSLQKRKVKREDDDEEEATFDDTPSRVVPKKKKVAVKREDSDDESDDNFVETRKIPSKKKKPVKRPISSDESDDDDSDEDFVETRKIPTKRPAAKKNATPERKKVLAKVKPEPRVKTESQSGSASGKRKATAAGGNNTKRSKPKKEVKSEKGTRGALKQMNKMERLDQAMKAFKWWEHEDLPDGVQWLGMEHNGLAFPPEYEPHGVPLLYKGEPIELSPELEELATFYAAVPDDGPQLGDPETRTIFQKNFFTDFKKMLGKSHKVQEFKHCDFSRIAANIAEQKMINKAATDVEKANKKREKEELQFKYGFAIVDKHLERVGNTMCEPPSLFRGRGKHPLMGKVKQRCTTEQVSLNLAETTTVPRCPQPGHAWGAVQHDNSVTWLATWHENILGKNKYVMLAAQSSFKGKSDRDKYLKAMKLKGSIKKIRADYKKNLDAKDKFSRQLATAMWVIDVLALRVGGEKGDDEADTVGCCSLRVEHLHCGLPEQGPHEIELEFLGKDSMLYKETTDFGREEYGDTGKKVYKNLIQFCKGKKQEQQVLDLLNPPELNRHLQTLMPGLTAKVFRTYNASETLQNELPSPSDLQGKTVPEKVLAYNEANRKVAILCNHQRTVSKAMQTNMSVLGERLKLLQRQKVELGSLLKQIKKGGNIKSSQKSKDMGKQAVDDAKLSVEKAKAMTQKAETSEQKIAATQSMEKAKEAQKKARLAAAAGSHLFAKVPSEEQVKKRIDVWREKIRKLELDIRNKDDNKEVALGTSKINYCDPRITVAWLKRTEVPVERVFPKTLRDKFVWAMPVPPDWSFHPIT